MKLQVNANQATDFAIACGDRTGQQHTIAMLKLDSRLVVSEFATAGHDPFTLRDLRAVLVKMGYDESWLKNERECWAVFNEITGACDRVKKADGKNRKGYYTQGAMKPNHDTLTQIVPTIDPPTPAQVFVDKLVEAEAEAGDLPDPNGKIEIKIVPQDGVTWSPTLLSTSPSDESVYSVDVGLRRMAVAQTTCFGNFGPGEAACNSCPLAAWCSSSSMGALQDIANDLDMATQRTLDHAEETERQKRRENIRLKEERDRRAKAAAYAKANPAPAPSPVAPTPPAGGGDTDSQLKAKYGAGGFSIIKLPFEGVCSTCDKKLDKGANAVHLSGDGMHHTACALSRS